MVVRLLYEAIGRNIGGIIAKPTCELWSSITVRLLPVVRLLYFRYILAVPTCKVWSCMAVRLLPVARLLYFRYIIVLTTCKVWSCMAVAIFQIYHSGAYL